MSILSKLERLVKGEKKHHHKGGKKRHAKRHHRVKRNSKGRFTKR